MTDYVDRNKVLSGEEFFGEHATWDNPTTEGCFAVRSDFIMNLPAADVVEVRHGRWELHDNGDGTCSWCGSLQKHIWDMDGWQNFCGHCGADMRNGGQDDA